MYVRKNTHTDFIIIFGNNLKKIRQSRGLTQAQLAIDCSFDVSVISRIERGIVNTSLSNLYTIATALNIQVSELFNFSITTDS